LPDTIRSTKQKIGSGTEKPELVVARLEKGTEMRRVLSDEATARRRTRWGDRMKSKKGSEVQKSIIKKGASPRTEEQFPRVLMPLDANAI